MSICWDCYRKNACGILYCKGEQQVCQVRENAYQSYQNYLEWLARPNEFNAGYLFYRGDN